jgi:hypothetical protein
MAGLKTRNVMLTIQHYTDNTKIILMILDFRFERQIWPLPNPSHMQTLLGRAFVTRQACALAISGSNMPLSP